jgi:TonB family protein
LVFDVRANLWITANGTIERIVLEGSSGSPTTDQALIDALQGLHLDAAPPPKLSMPIRASMRGRRPS